MSFAIQLDKVIRAQTFDPLSLGTALVMALVMGAGWAFVAGWIRVKLIPTLADDYARNIQLGFGLLSILLIAGLVYKVVSAA